ncbi:MAG: sensor histidine kinase [Desulfitobacterium sp.]
MNLSNGEVRAKTQKKDCPNLGHESVCPVEMQDCPCPGRKLRIETVEVQEMEAKRWAMELHDGVLPLLASLNMEVEYCAELAQEGAFEVQEQLFLIKHHVGSIYEEIRHLCSQLRPSALGDYRNLLKMIHSYVERFCQENQLQAQIDLPQESLGEYDINVDIFLFRILQECLSNIRKHAKAQKVHVQLTLEKRNFILIVSDDGRGFVPDQLDKNSLLSTGKIGIINMRERASIMGGDLTIVSQLHRGTTVRLSIPRLGHHGSDLK